MSEANKSAARIREEHLIDAMLRAQKECHELRARLEAAELHLRERTDQHLTLLDGLAEIFGVGGSGCDACIQKLESVWDKLDAVKKAYDARCGGNE